MSDTPYLRIGTRYYKFVVIHYASGDSTTILVPWDKTTIKEDHGAEIFSKIPKYDNHTIIPDNINYQRVIGKIDDFKKGSYNLYEPISYKPKKGKFEKTFEFLKHIFGEQIEIGLDYLTIIHRHPTHILPVLCLVSYERKTGKSTFLNWLKLIYGSNMTINTDEDFRNNFNSGWSTKLIIGGEEISLNKKEDIEKLKNLSTTRTIKSEAKGKDKIECEFFGKFILCSNNEDDFIKIDHNEIRFWVRKVPSIKKEIPDFDRGILQKEIPAFLHFLQTREILHEEKTRMWFTREQLYTPALQKVINGSTSRLELETKEIIIDYLISFDLESAKLAIKDIINQLSSNNFRATVTQVKEILKKWGLQSPSKAERYNLYYFASISASIEYTNKVGRCYEFKKDDFIK